MKHRLQKIHFVAKYYHKPVCTNAEIFVKHKAFLFFSQITE